MKSDSDFLTKSLIYAGALFIHAFTWMQTTGRHTEQHDVFFGLGNELKDLIPDILKFWPDPEKIHIDAWRKVTLVDDYLIKVVEKNESDNKKEQQLFFLNLGGYKEYEFEEFHYRMLAVSSDKAGAIAKARSTAFFRHTGFAGANAHIDDKYGVDVDDLYEIEEILPVAAKENFSIQLLPARHRKEDEWHLGYTKLSSLI